MNFLWQDFLLRFGLRSSTGKRTLLLSRGDHEVHGDESIEKRINEMKKEQEKKKKGEKKKGTCL